MLAAMSLYAKRLVIVSGKGGVGKSTVSAAIGMAAAGHGLRTLLIEVASQERMSLLFDQGGPIGYHATPVYPGLDAFSIDPQKALEEYLVGQLKVRAVVERLVENRAFGHVTAAAPGLRELVTLAKIRQLLERGRHDFVVVDAPATGHGLGFLKVPRTFTRVARVGPVHARAIWVAELLEDPAQTAVVLVTTPEELPVTETLEAIADIDDHAVPLAGVVANAVYEPLFDAADAEALAPVRGSGDAAAAAVGGPRPHRPHRRPARAARAGAAVPGRAAVPVRAPARHDRRGRARREAGRRCEPRRSSWTNTTGGGVRGRGRRRQDDHRGGARGRDGRSAGGACSCSRSTRPGAWPARSACPRPTTTSTRSTWPPTAWPARARLHAAMLDAAAHVRRARARAGAVRGGGRPHPAKPDLPAARRGGGRARTSTWRWSGSTRCGRAGAST